MDSKASRVSRCSPGTGGTYSGAPALPARHQAWSLPGSSTVSGRHRERLTSPPTSRRWCPTCPGAHSACRPASGCRQPGWSSPSGNARSYWWCRTQNAWLRGISETPTCSTRKQRCVYSGPIHKWVRDGEKPRTNKRRHAPSLSQALQCAQHGNTPGESRVFTLSNGRIHFLQNPSVFQSTYHYHKNRFQAKPILNLM